MRCAACGAENRPGRKFCGQCGAALQRLCPSCSAPNDESERFCGECGTPLQGAAPAALETPVDDAAGQAERRHVTVLFADLVGFTPLADQRDAEDVRELLSRYFVTARTVIQRYGGVVEKFIGDAVMAVWGATAIQEEDAERAVRAALELIDAVAAFGEEVGAPGLRARAGVLTGEAAVRVGATSEGMVAGDLVNTASRVQSAAPPGAVYVGEATRQVSEAAIVYEDTGVHELKGKPEPLRLWRALRVVAARGGSMRPTGLEPPFVGRERQLRLLKDFLHGTAEEGKSRLLSIVGLAGIGKSRLAWEFEKYVDGLSETIYWHRGRCLAYGEGVAYWALAEMIRMRASLAENEPQDSAREKLHRTIAQFVADEDERQWVEPRLRQLLGLEESAASDPRDLYAAWRFFFERMATVRTTVLVFEDLQWADSGLLDFIEYLLEWSRNSPILVITLARPEVAERRPGWGIGKRGLTSLYLEPLPPDAMEALLTGLVPGLPADLQARILERAAGIPLYAVETVRMLLDRGLLLAQPDGTFATHGSLQALEVPESLHAMIAARLDGLASPQRHLLQDAAVLGKAFTPAALAVVSEMPHEDVETGLAALVDKDLLAIQSDPRSPERGQYVFVQDLVRSVALGTLPRRERRARHLAAAAFLESSWSGEEGVAEVIAAHLVSALETDPTAEDAAEIRQRARTALVRAGQHANSLAAQASAQRYYEQAIALADDEEMRADLHMEAGAMASLQSAGAAAREHFAEALRLREHRGDEVGSVRASIQLSRADMIEGRIDSAITRLRTAKEHLTSALPATAERDAMLAEITDRLGAFLYFQGDLDSALTYIETALQIAEGSGLVDVIISALDTKSWILTARGRWEEGELLEAGALRLALARGLTQQVIRCQTNLAETIYERDRPEEAVELFEQAERQARRAGDRQFTAYAYLTKLAPLLDLGRWDDCAGVYASYLENDAADLRASVRTVGLAAHAVWLFSWRGEADRARRVLEDSVAGFAGGDGGDPAPSDLQALFGAARAATAYAEGRFEDALAAAEAALDTALTHGFPMSARRAFVDAAEAAFALRRGDAVGDLIGQARRHYSAGLQPSLEAHIVSWEARLDALQRDDDGPGDDFARAIEAFEQLGRPFPLAQTRLEYARWLVSRTQIALGLDQAAQAAAVFESLGAAPWVARAAELVARAGGATLPSASRAIPA